jgi:hypothetical protein
MRVKIETAPADTQSIRRHGRKKVTPLPRVVFEVGYDQADCHPD